MTTTTKTHPVAQALVNFINDEATLWSIHSQVGETNNNMATNIYRLIMGWQDARREMAKCADRITRHADEVKRALIDGNRTDASWLKNPVADLELEATKSEIYANQLLWHFGCIDMDSDTIDALFAKLNKDAVERELTV